MITTESELKSALQWIDYWNSTRQGAPQSWLGNEQAAQKIVQLRRDVADYRRRQAGKGPIPAVNEIPSGQT
ncbi:MAG: hypothetical protein ACRDFX_04270 [Chloroflexota bacterium]